MKKNLLRIFGLLLSVFAVSLTASAYDFKVDGVYYNFTKSNEVEVTFNKTNDYKGNVTIPSLVNYEGDSFLVTSIGNSAFKRCEDLKSISIPYSVTTLDDYAFYDCYGLTSISIPNSVTTIGEYAFSRCSGLTSVTIPNSVTAIGNYAFENCSRLTSISIPNSVTTIGNSAFEYCSGLTSISIPNSVTTIGNSAFYHCSRLTSISIPNSVTTIGNSAFEYCSGLTKVEISDIASWCNINFGNYSANPLYYAKHLYLKGVEIKDLVIPDGVSSINNYAFYTCRGLTSVTIPNSVTNIGSYAFENCSGLKKVEISDLVSWCNINFGDYSANPLYYAKHLYLKGVEIKDLVIPDGVTSINNYAFYDYNGLTSVTIPNSVKTIGNYAFSNCSGLTSILIPNSVTTIGNYVFSNCSGLTSISIPNSVITIGNYAFYYCSGLTSISIPNSVTIIGDKAFENCNRLQNISIGNNIQTIGSSAFAECNKLSIVNIYATEAPNMSSNSFPYNTATFHVPRGCKANYAYLYTFGNIIDDLENDEDFVDEIFRDDANARINIYNLAGQIVKINADKGDVETLKPGLYIINGKRVLIK